MTPTVPISKLLARFIKDRKSKGDRTREAKLDTASALVRKERLEARPYDRLSGTKPPVFGLRIPVRNEVKMSPKDKDDLARLEKELGPVSLREFLRSRRRPEPDIVRPKR
jgi:hypothetical protein